MKKIDSLLKKAELYEKLAIYSDRKLFLKSLAQARALNNDMRSRLSSLIADLYALTGNRTKNLQDNLQSFYDGTKTDWLDLSQTIREAAALIPTSTNGPQHDRALELAQMVQNLTPATEAGPDLVGGSSRDYSSSPQSNINDYSKPATQTYNPIPKDVQKMLSEISTAKGWGLPLKIDGTIGPDTQRALNSFKLENNLTTATNPELFENIKQNYKTEFDNRKYLDNQAFPDLNDL